MSVKHKSTSSSAIPVEKLWKTISVKEKADVLAGLKRQMNCWHMP